MMICTNCGKGIPSNVIFCPKCGKIIDQNNLHKSAKEQSNNNSNNGLLEPLKYYNEVLRKLFIKNTEELFDELVRESKIDVEANRSSVARYKSNLHDAENSEKLINKYNLFNGLCIAGIAICVFFVLYNATSIYKSNNFDMIKVLLIIGALSAGILLVIIKINKINSTLSTEKETKNTHTSEAEEIKKECFKQMNPLNNLFDSNHTRKLIMKTIPEIVVDNNMKIDRFSILSDKYGLLPSEELKDWSVQDLITGEIVGNPYAICRFKAHILGEFTYTGSIDITYDDFYIDSQGKEVRITRTETLTAEITKPKPYYSQFLALYYGNEAAPNLVFSRSGSHIEQYNDKDLAKLIKKGSKNLQKLAKNVVKDGGSFTPIGNDEFDVLFNAMDRNNESEFRLLFTPLAQKNMLDLLKHSPYGDDFSFKKINMMNVIESEHSEDWDLVSIGEKFANFDIDDSREVFRDFQTQYFDNFFFNLAPILSIPLYQQYKPQEKIYKHMFKGNYSNYQAESLANKISAKYFNHPNTKTDTLLKTYYNCSDNTTDIVNVKAFSYDAIDRIDLISVCGGDGLYHDVPVHWIEYKPIYNELKMCLKELDISEKEFKNNILKPNFISLVNKYKLRTYVYYNNIFAFIGDGNIKNDLLNDEIEALFN